MEESVYNATVTGKILLTPDLMVLRVKTDEHRDMFEAGQFTTLGLYAKEPRSTNSVAPIKELEPDKLIKRPYSIASANHQTNNFEFYISQVKSGQLTPRLFQLELGSRLWIDNRILGVFKLNETPKDSNIVMIATGTGLAPYISFLRSHIKDHQNIKLAVIHGAAYPWDLGYLSELEFMETTFTNFHYFPTLLKADDTWHGLRGYIEEHLKNGLLEKAGIEINPEKTHFFLCGNPNMVKSVSDFLADFGYTRHTKKNPGALHVESW
jgi:ferredoxin--NADP+ reductase